MTNLPQIARPDLIVPDTGPLIHLAQADALHLLHQIGGRVVVADMVALEATQDMDKPGAREIEAWIEAGRQPGSNTPVIVAPTEIGELFQQARKTDPTIRPRNAGELAILEWLGSYVDRMDSAGHAVLIVYENGKIPRFVRETGLDLDTDVLTTRAFLELAERRSAIASADEYWHRRGGTHGKPRHQYHDATPASYERRVAPDHRCSRPSLRGPIAADRSWPYHAAICSLSEPTQNGRACPIAIWSGSVPALSIRCSGTKTRYAVTRLTKWKRTDGRFWLVFARR